MAARWCCSATSGAWQEPNGGRASTVGAATSGEARRAAAVDCALCKQPLGLSSGIWLALKTIGVDSLVRPNQVTSAGAMPVHADCWNNLPSRCERCGQTVISHWRLADGKVSHERDECDHYVRPRGGWRTQRRPKSWTGKCWPRRRRKWRNLKRMQAIDQQIDELPNEMPEGEGQ